MERLGNRTTTTFNEVSGYNGPVVGVMTEEEMGGEVYPKKPKDVLSDGESSFFKEPKWEGVSHTPLIEFSRLEVADTKSSKSKHRDKEHCSNLVFHLFLPPSQLLLLCFLL